MNSFVSMPAVGGWENVFPIRRIDNVDTLIKLKNTTN